MPGTSVEDLQTAANMTLREALRSERSKNWPKVIKCYRRLLRMLSKDHLPIGFQPPSGFSNLLYELHYYLGLALQYDNQHRKAALQFAQSIKAVSVPKNGCSAGCRATTCLTTPVYTRKAFAHAVVGEFREALCAAEQAVVLDSSNPDVFCVRAMVRNTQGEEKQALRDVETALKMHSSHPCALILRGSMTAPLVSLYSAWSGEKQGPNNPDHEKACNINPDCRRFLSVETFHHQEALQFYDRLLFSLTVPHTVSSIRLPVNPTGQTQKKTRPNSCASSTRSYGYGVSSQAPSEDRVPSTVQRPESGTPFRCGTPASSEHARTTLRRRKQYGEAIRAHQTKPKQHEEFIAYLESGEWQRQWKRCDSTMSMTSHVSDISQISETSRRASAYQVSVSPLDNTHQTRKNSASSVRSVVSMATRPTSSGMMSSYQSQHASRPISRATSTVSNEDSYVTPIEVFQPVNLEDISRTYYRPWKGDILPSGDRKPKRNVGPPFK